jgi:predicted dehydrogenase
MLPDVFPEARIFAPNAGEPSLRWGVLAPGEIARSFAQAMRQHTAQRLIAVASRSKERAAAFAGRFEVEAVHDSYEALVANPEVDVVYVAAPASEHVALGLLAIAAGKHVLIEKPLATDAAGARRLANAARSRSVFLMEAMWSRYLPQASVIRRLIADGVIGIARGVIADHSQAVAVDPDHRLYRADLGGGALLDLGIYPIQFDSMIFGAPQQITAIGGLTETGVDAYSTLVLGHGPAVQSTVTTSILARAGSRATVFGDTGRIDIDGPHHVPTTLTLRDNNVLGPRLTWSDPTGISFYGGLSWEATAVATFIGEGRIESPLHTLDETVSILETIDEAQRQLRAAAVAVDRMSV